MFDEAIRERLRKEFWLDFPRKERKFGKGARRFASGSEPSSKTDAMLVLCEISTAI